MRNSLADRSRTAARDEVKLDPGQILASNFSRLRSAQLNNAQLAPQLHRAIGLVYFSSRGLFCVVARVAVSWAAFKLSLDFWG